MRLQFDSEDSTYYPQGDRYATGEGKDGRRKGGQSEPEEGNEAEETAEAEAQQVEGEAEEAGSRASRDAPALAADSGQSYPTPNPTPSPSYRRLEEAAHGAGQAVLTLGAAWPAGGVGGPVGFGCDPCGLSSAYSELQP